MLYIAALVINRHILLTFRLKYLIGMGGRKACVLAIRWYEGE